MMQFFTASKVEPPTGTVHVALLDAAGAILIHEEIPAAGSYLRRSMIEGQAAIDADNGQDRQVHFGKEWPPEGHELKKGKIVPLVAAE